MTELMKRYEAERGGIMPCGMEIQGGFIYSKEYVAWLESQLTWRPASEKPESMGMYLAEVRPYMGNVDVIVATVYFNGESFLGYDDVVRWLPIPPMKEGE